MKKNGVLIYGWVACLFAFCLAVTAFAAGQKQGPSTGKGAPLSRVEQFLSELQKVQNADQAANLLKRLNLNESEQRQVAEELGKPAWAARLNAIKSSTHPSPHPPTPQKFQGRSSQKIIADLQTSLKKEHDRKAAIKKQKFQSRLASVRGAAKAAPPRKISAGSGRLVAAANPYGADPSTAALIDAVNPQQVVVGQTVTINGRRFTNTTGRVVVRTETDIFPCEVLTWNDSRITARIPQSVFPWNSMQDVPSDVHGENADALTGKDVYLWVKLAGGEVGPWYQIKVSADVSLLTPAIDAVSPTDLEPGSDLLIEGSNFGDQASHMSWVKLEITFGGQAIELDIIEWRNSYIVARVDENISGVQAMNGGILKVSNRLNLEAVKGGLSFTPEMEIQDIEHGPFKAKCSPFFICLFGEIKTYDAYDLELRHGWTVQDRWIEIIHSNSQGPNYGGYFEHTPEIGSTYLRTKVVAWADAFSKVECRSHVLVSGPKGTDYR